MKAKTRIPELDGLRGLAVLMVMISHLYVLTYWGPWELPWLKRLLGICDQGVDMFFVLSGFLIGGIVLEGRGKQGFLSGFYWRRAFRIAPPYLMLLASFAVVAALQPSSGFSFAAYTEPSFPAWVYATLTQSLFIPAAMSVGPAWLAVTWSLSVEELFYLSAPALLRRAADRTTLVACAVVVTASPLLRLILTQGMGNRHMLYAFPCRADGLALGILLALVMRQAPPASWTSGTKRKLAFAAMALIAAEFAAALLTPAARMSLEWALPTLHTLEAGAIIAAVLAFPASTPAGLLRMAWLRAVGKISYFLYLFHLPFQYTCFTWEFGDAEWLTAAGLAANTVVSVALLFAAAWASWLMIESPLQDLARKRLTRDTTVTPGQPPPGPAA